MYLTFCCPKCDKTGRVELDDNATKLTCPSCAGQLAIPEAALTGGQVHRCLVCPSTELFVRKDFPQRLGVAIVVLGLAASCVTWYYHMIYATFGILFATALVDLVLYLCVGELLVCYRCQAEYRGTKGLEKHAAFLLQTHERFRQQRARRLN